MEKEISGIITQEKLDLKKNKIFRLKKFLFFLKTNLRKKNEAEKKSRHKNAL